MMNINIIPPAEGYLERVRELTAEHGAKLIFDEVKTGATISYGGATKRFGVTPDIVTLAKAICGGYPGRGDRDDRGDRRAGGERQGPSVRHLQRQPAGDGRLAWPP